MTIAAATNKIIIAGDGVTTTFAFPMILPSDSTGSDLQLFVIDNLGNVTLLTTNYTVNVGAKTVSYPTVGGVSPLGPGVNAVPNGWQLAVVRTEPLSQLLHLVNQGVFDAPSIELALDKIVMVLQQFQEILNRCVTVPINSPGGGAGPVIPPTTAVLPFYQGTLTQIVALASANPAQPAWGYASDQNNGLGQLMYYTANLLVGNPPGWLQMPTSFFGG